VHGRFHGIRTKNSRKRRETGYAMFRRNEPVWGNRKADFAKNHPQLLKAVLLIALALPVSLISSYGYYALAVAPPLQNASPGDPFTTLWDGRTTGSGLANPPKLHSDKYVPFASCNFNQVMGPLAVTAGDVIVVATHADGGVNASKTTLGDTVNTYTRQLVIQQGFISAVVFTAIASTSTSLTLTVGNPANGVNCDIEATSWTGAHTVGVSATFGTDTPANSGSNTLALTPTQGANSFIIEGVGGITGTALSCFSFSFAPATSNDNSCFNGGISSESFNYGDWKRVNGAPVSMQVSWTGGGGGNFGLVHWILELGTDVFTSCSPGYNCFNAFQNLAASISLLPTSTFPAVAVSQSSADLSTVVSKELSIAEQFGTTGGSGPWAIFLTLNSTVPAYNATGGPAASGAASAYTPMTDPNVALAFEFFNVGGGNTRFYVYMSRTGHQNLLATDGRGANPGETACQSQVIFLCGHAVNTGGNFGFVGNYTAHQPNSNTTAISYMCMANQTGSNCAIGGNPSGTSSVIIGTATQTTTSVLPWLNLQQQYYVGFWRAPETGNVTTNWFNLKDVSCLACNIISIYAPGNTPGNVVEGGFFGWIGRALGGAWNVAAGALGPLVSPLLNIGSGILSTVMGALVQWINVMITGGAVVVSTALNVLRIILNTIGNFIGWGPIGDQFFNFASGVITYFTVGLSDALGWLIRLITQGINLIKVANFWVNFYLNGLANFMADALNVIAEVVVFGQKLTVFFGSSYVLIDVLIFLWFNADEGLTGWYNWFETTKWLAFISFDFLERMINFGISSITWLFGRIPTLDGTTLPELPTIAIGGGPSFPSTEMTALREGNLSAYFGMMIGTAFLIYFETSGLPGSIGSNVTGTAAGVMAPFLTMMLIMISVMGLLFILAIPAQVARGSFGLDDLVSPKMSKFSTGPARAGGVSGQLVRRHPERKAQLVVHHGLGLRGLRPHLRRPTVHVEAVPKGPVAKA